MTPSKSPVQPVQEAVYARLTGDTDLASLAPGGVHDQVPEGRTYPYIRIGDHLSVPDNDHGGFGREITSTVHVWSKARGNKAGQSVADRVVELLDHQPAQLAVTGHRVVSIRCEFDQAVADPDPQIRHHVLRFRIITDQEEAP